MASANGLRCFSVLLAEHLHLGKTEIPCSVRNVHHSLASGFVVLPERVKNDPSVLLSTAEEPPVALGERGNAECIERNTQLCCHVQKQDAVSNCSTCKTED